MSRLPALALAALLLPAAPARADEERVRCGVPPLAELLAKWPEKPLPAAE